MLGREVLNSNTTLVKVKSSISFVSSLIAAIQIQHLLKLNFIKKAGDYVRFYSNTTLVKVKF